MLGNATVLNYIKLHIFTTYYAFPYVETQNLVSAKNSNSCPFPNEGKQRNQQR